MNYRDFTILRETDQIPADLAPLLKALLFEARGDWDGAHSIAQEDASSLGSLVHAYLHRVEGDKWNANYWYARASRSMPDISLEDEWEHIAQELCAT